MTYAQRTDAIKKIEDLGENWGAAIQREATEAGVARIKAGSTDKDGYVEVWVPVRLKLRFERAGDAVTLAPDGGLRCACVFHPYPEGGGACVCTGPDAASCDCSDGGVA